MQKQGLEGSNPSPSAMVLIIETTDNNILNLTFNSQEDFITFLCGKPLIVNNNYILKLIRRIFDNELLVTYGKKEFIVTKMKRVVIKLNKKCIID